MANEYENYVEFLLFNCLVSYCDFIRFYLNILSTALYKLYNILITLLSEFTDLFFVLFLQVPKSW